MLSRFFRLHENGTTVGRELQAGLTTFAAMAYVLAVNPSILVNAGMDRPALVTITALSAAVATALMALLTNYPIALAPGRGITAFFAYTSCLGAGVPWAQALGMVFVNGCIFLLLSVTGVREKIVDAIPYPLKIAVTCGIGIFIAFLGLTNGGVIVASPATFVTHGDFASGPVALCLAGILLIAALVRWRVPGAIVLGMAVLTLVGVLVPDGKGGTVTQLPSPADWFSLPASPAPHLLKLDLHFLTDGAAFLKTLPLILSLLLVDMFDNIGTLIGVTKRAGFLGADGKLPKVGRVLVADSAAAILSSLLGTWTVVSYVESSAGGEAGGRTGLTTLTTAVLMVAALFLTPLILAVPAAATAPARVIGGIFMLQSVTEIDMGDFSVVVPAMLTLMAIPLTSSVALGIGLGLIAAAVLALVTGKPRSFSPMGYAIAAVFFLEFFHLFPFHG